MKFWDRIRQKAFSSLDKNIDLSSQNFLLGQWQILPEKNLSKLNGIDLNQDGNIYLVPDATKRWNLRINGKTLAGQIPAWQLPADLAADSLCFFEQDYQKMLSLNQSWLDWANTSPLVPEIDRAIQIQPLEKIIKDTIPHLEEICHRPRSYLKLETERLPVARAQRIAPHAISYLAGHTEDWEYKTFRGVRPKRVLSLVREDLLDIYENRVTVRLIDYLLAYLRQRIHNVEKLKAELEQTQNFSDEASGKIYWRNRDRLCRIWGDNFDHAPQLKSTVETTLNFLKQIKQKLLSLTDTDLYKVIPRNVQIDSTLKNTNILVSDRHYREVAKLWREWSKWQTKQKKTSQQLFDYYQQSINGFDVFCFLLCSKVLAENNSGLGFTLEGKMPQRGNSYSLDKDNQAIQLQWSADGCIQLQSGELKTLTLIPVVSQLTETPDEKTTEHILSLLQSLSNNKENQYTVILYFGSAQDLSQLPQGLQQYFNTLGNDLLDRFKGDSKIALLPVSPLDILSTERVARAIQWWLYSQRYSSYPIRKTVILPNIISSQSEWIRQDHQKTIVLKPPSSSDRQNFLDQLDALIKQEKSKGLSSKGEIAKLIELKSLAETIEQDFSHLLACPICQIISSLHFRSIGNDCFQTECQECEISWGLKKCGKCEKNYPYIKPKFDSSKLIAQEIGWVDSVFGRDILAVPCSQDKQLQSYICPSCGVCGNSQKVQAYSCKRCFPK